MFPLSYVKKQAKAKRKTNIVAICTSIISIKGLRVKIFYSVQYVSKWKRFLLSKIFNQGLLGAMGNYKLMNLLNRCSADQDVESSCGGNWNPLTRHQGRGTEVKTWS